MSAAFRDRWELPPFWVDPSSPGGRKIDPERERQATHVENVSPHAAPALLSLGGNGSQLVDGFDVLAGVGGNQGHTAVNGVTVAVNEARNQEFAFQINLLRPAPHGFNSLCTGPHSHNLVAAHRHRFRVRMLGLRGKDLAVVEHALFNPSCEQNSWQTNTQP